MSRLFIRTEASAEIGMGHFMRCFAVAEAARARKIPVMFLLNHVDWAIEARCRPTGIVAEPVHDMPHDIPGLQNVLLADDWLLIDSYEADATYIATMHAKTRVAVIDDLDGLDRFACDLLINPSMAAPRVSYESKSSARLLLGTDYALIRREFTKPGSAVIDQPSVVVMFGGSDPTGLTGRIAEALHDAVPDRLIKVIAGPANTRIGELETLAARLPNLHLFVSPPSVAKVLLKSDLVVTAAGGSVLETAAMGLPALVLVAYDNQQPWLEACPYPVIDIRQGLPDDLGARVASLMADPENLKSSGRAARAIVDGRGAKRIIEAMFGK